MNLAEYQAQTGVTPYRFRELLEQHGADVTHQTVWQWFIGKRMPSPKHFAAIEAASDGKVTRAALRPDIFGDAKPKAKPVNKPLTKRRNGRAAA